MKLATWNVNSLKVRLPQLLDWLAQAKPDVVCLQETKAEDAKFPCGELEAAGYYSYKWAEVLSADAYAEFEEHGVLDPRTGARFRDEVLAVGGSRPAAESFRPLRGREPRVEALLRHNGMIAASPA